MTSGPQISVVMSVYNGAEALRSSLQSVFSQKGADFEIIVIDDGSDDASGAMLNDLAAADSRLRVSHQGNQGLTRALIRGCEMAKGKYIARQDCGDLSLPGRLLAELQVLESQPEAVFVSCGTSFVGPEGEPLYDVVVDEGEANAGLLTLDPRRLRGPSHHGSTMFSRALYEYVGGYREQFYFAQDLDLWTRMAEHGRHVALPDLLYQARFTPGSISSTQRRRQIECAGIILDCARLRRAGLDESPALERARSILPETGNAKASEVASALYFVGVCLQKKRNPRAAGYFRRALQANPLHLKAALRLLAG